jgi:hypothetical protein
MSMRIAIVSVHTSPLARPGGNKTGGLNVYVRELALQLAQRGCQIDIFSRATDRDMPGGDRSGDWGASFASRWSILPLAPASVKQLDALSRLWRTS